MPSDTNVEAELDMIVLHIKNKILGWERLEDPVSVAVAGELTDLATEIEDRSYWNPQD